MYELTNIQITEQDMLDAVVKLEMYMNEIETRNGQNDYYKEVKAIHDRMNKIWWEMKADETYILAERPF